MNGPVLVTDGTTRPSLAAVRSLGRTSRDVVVTSKSGRSLAGASRHCDLHVQAPDPTADSVAYARAIGAVAGRAGVRVLLPVSEASLRALLPRRELFPDTRIPFPDAAAFRRAADKVEVSRLAERLGLSTPTRKIVADRDELDDVDCGALEYPLVVKPSRSHVERGAGTLELAVQYARSPSHCRRLLGGLPANAFPVMLQARIRGPGVGIFLLRWNGRLLARFAHRRLREKPPWGGVSTYRSSLCPSDELFRASNRLLSELDWFGPAMVEFKVDRSTGEPYLMEVNPRLWGSLQLAIDAGVDFPRLLLQLAAGHQVPPRSDYRADVRSRWWWGDVDHLIIRLRWGTTPPGLPGRDTDRRERSKLRAVLSFLRVKACDRTEVLRSGDPLPFLLETADWLATAGRSVATRLLRRE